MGAGAVAGSGLVPDAYTQTVAPHKETAAVPGQSHPTSIQHGAFFNYEQATTIAAFTERLMPGAPGKPGARDAGVPNYIDLALAGAYADLQDFYRRGLAQLDAYCRTTYKASFSLLEPARQDEVITALEQGKAACLPTRFTAVIANLPAGAWWVSPALKAISRQRICKTNKCSRAHP